jgi:PIN domain nuclease of toxin-antitoxin system
MTLSLDTNAFLWWLDDPQLLSKAARKAIGDGKNTVYVSAAVVWEIAIKKALGKLDAPDDLEERVIGVSSFFRSKKELIPIII